MNTLFGTPVKEYDVVMVCGLYKSGTSMTAKLLEDIFGFYNPAHYTNPHGKAIGRNGDLYSTRECNILFKINEALMNGNSLDSQNNSLLSAYLLNWPRPFVLKDPKLVYTLPLWLDAAHSQGLKCLVTFTNRSADELMTSWQKAQYTGGLLARNSEAMDTMLAEQARLIEHCKALGLENILIDFEEVKDLCKTLNIQANG